MRSLFQYARRHHLGLVAVFFAISGSAYAVSGSSAPHGVQWDGHIAGKQAATVEPPYVLRPQFSAEPPRPTSKQIQAAEEQMKRSRQAWANRQVAPSGEVAGLPPGTETEISGGRASGDLTILRNKTLTPGRSSSTNEPSVSQSGKNIWYTGNWYAARSASGGKGWGFVDPFDDFANFCCDQDTVYDPARNLHLWYRQGSVSGTQNVFKLGASTDGGESWCTFTYSPTDLDPSWTNRWFDYPGLHLTNDSLYITTNLFPTGSQFSERGVLIRYSLDSLRACSPAPLDDYWSRTDASSWQGVEGATTTMYLGDQINTGTNNFRIYQISDGSSDLTYMNRTIPAWTPSTRGDSVCTIQGGTNPCGNSDERILAGWRRQLDSGAGEIGFMWNVAQGGTFPQPYVEAATFEPPSLTYRTRPAIWNSGAAYQYPSVGPDDRGALGINLTQFTSSTFPTQKIGIDDDFNGVPPGWELYSVNSSSAGPDADRWGDYSRIRAFQPLGIGWVASNYSERPGLRNARARYTLFARERDTSGMKRWWGKGQ